MHYSRKWTISYVWPDMSTLMSQLSTWNERHSSDEEIPSILQNASLSNRIQGGWLGGGFGPNHFFLIYKGHYLLYKRRENAILPFLPLYISQTLLPSLYSKSYNNQAPQQRYLSALHSARKAYFYKPQNHVCRCHTNNLASLSALSTCTINIKKWS